MTSDLEKLMTPEEMRRARIDTMTEEQCRALVQWGMRMYSVGQHIVAEIEEIKYDGRLIKLDDGTRWEVDEFDADTAEMWSPFDKVVIIDGEMYKLDDTEKVTVDEDLG